MKMYEFVCKYGEFKHLYGHSRAEAIREAISYGFDFEAVNIVRDPAKEYNILMSDSHVYMHLALALRADYIGGLNQ